jgi:hypothetical protein
MKKFLSLFLILGFLALIGCSDDATGPGGGLGGGGGGGGVTFTMGTTQGQNGGTVFTFKPSTSVTVTTLTVKYPAQPFEDVLTNPNPNTVFDSQNTYSTEGTNGEGEYTGVQSGQQWQFIFVGKLESSTGTAYNVTVNYTIP